MTLLAVCVLAATHVLAGKLRFLEGVPRSRWLSFAGGVSVAYVVVRILPELSAGQREVDHPANALLPFLEGHVYLLTLAGLVAFYGVERSSSSSRARRREASGIDATDRSAFVVSIGGFAVYNVIVGYVLADFDATREHSLAALAAALAVHFLVNDYGLREHHKDAYRDVGRWVLAAAVLVGWAIGRSAELDEAGVALLVAFLAGGIILNTFKEELPRDRESRFLPFVAGAAGYAALLQLV
ncbi:MAG TPA: hypothetical protein VHF88_00420 [Thermoleophilaceae bacterium]|nr:hypothetical protein [Thermoleophilaceae bacterium]